MKSARAVLLSLAVCASSALAAGPTWDTSGNGQLSGTYYFRQVLYVGDSGANVSRAFAFYGNISFDGNGNYTIANGSLLDSNSGLQSYATSGTYSVSSTGYGFLADPIVNGGNVSFLVSNHLLIGSSTESGYNGLFVAAPFTAFTNASFTGAYAVSGFFPGGSPASAADCFYQLAPDGAGHLGTVNITGFSGGGGSTSISQSSPGVTYTFSNGAAAITFPNSTTANFYTGPIFLYMSPDKNFVFGGSPNGYDFFMGVRVTGAPGSTTLSGLYYETGIDEDTSPNLDTYYGTFNAYQGEIIGHERLLTSGYGAEGNTYYATYPTSIGTSYTDPSGSVQYSMGASGIRIGFGVGPYIGIGVAMPFTPPAASGAVYLDPTGIVNTASSAPYTAGIAPGEFMTIYNGTGFANSTVIASVVPYPTSLGGVQVLVDGIKAPIYYVSSTQISFIVPYAVSTYPIATIQIVNGSGSSNTATVFVNQTAPGVFTSNPVGGTGYGAIEHGLTGLPVTPANPAVPGETVAAFVSGLGNVFPPNGDGAIGPFAEPLSRTTNNIFVYVNGLEAGGITNPLPYAGLAPYLAGLYQVNFTIPATAAAGFDVLGIGGPDSYSTESYIPVGTGSVSSARPAAETATPSRRRLPRMNIPGNGR